MVVTNRFRPFDDELLKRHPDLKEVLKPNDLYPELKRLLGNRIINLPIGSFNSKVIITDGEIVERIYKTPKGKAISLFLRSSMIPFDQAA